jgi:hypothetical protein
MAHGYGRGCRCEQCREKHRETQLKYRQGRQRQEQSAKVKRLEQRILAYGVSEQDAQALAREIKADFL